MLKPLGDDLWVDIDDISVVYFGKEKNGKDQVEVILRLRGFPEKVTYLCGEKAVQTLKEGLEERIRREEDERNLRGHRNNGSGP